MSLPKLAVTAVFLLSVCSPALAETIVGNDTQGSTPQNTNSVPESRLEDSKTPKAQPVKLNQNVLDSLSIQNQRIIHCCACSGSFNTGTSSPIGTRVRR